MTRSHGKTSMSTDSLTASCFSVAAVALLVCTELYMYYLIPLRFSSAAYNARFARTDDLILLPWHCNPDSATHE